MNKRENKLWNIVKYSLEKHYNYICTNPNSKRKKLRKGFINIGIGGIIPDVIGIREIGNRFEPRIEIIAVEVKENLPIYREREMDQVKRASIFAHKVFLAAPREFKPKEIELAVEKRIGLFEINLNSKKLKLILPSPLFEPQETKVIELMRKLEFFKCTICGCYCNKNLLKFTGYRPLHTFSDKKTIKFVKFICERCATKIYDLHSKNLKEKFLEEWKFRRISKKLEKFFIKTKNFVSKQDLSKNTNKINKIEEQIKDIKKRLRDSFNKKLEKIKKQLRKIKKSLKSI